MALKTDYKADVFEGNRKYQIIQDGEGKSEIQDVTVYRKVMCLVQRTLTLRIRQ